MAKLPSPMPRWFSTVYGQNTGAWEAAKESCREILLEWAREGRPHTYGELVVRLEQDVPGLQWPDGPHTHEGNQMGYLLGQVAMAELAASEDRPILSALVVLKEGDGLGLPSFGFWKFCRELRINVGNSDEARQVFWVKEFQRCVDYYGAQAPLMGGAS